MVPSQPPSSPQPSSVTAGSGVTVILPSHFEFSGLCLESCLHGKLADLFGCLPRAAVMGEGGGGGETTEGGDQDGCRGPWSIPWRPHC